MTKINIVQIESSCRRQIKCLSKGRKHCWKRKCWLPALFHCTSRFSKGYFLRGVIFYKSKFFSSSGAFRVVMCPSCVVNNFFKHLLLPNRWANLDQTWQEWSLGGPLQNLFTEFYSIKNSGCQGNEIEFFKQFFKNLLLWNLWSDCEIISQECSLCDTFQNISAKF